MDRKHAIAILAHIKAAWPKQPGDDATAQVWVETLESVPYDVACVAVVELIQTDRADPPTPGQVYEHSLKVWERQEARKRATIRKLPEPNHSPTELKSVQEFCDEYFVRHPGAVADERRQRLAYTTLKQKATDITSSVASSFDIDRRLHRTPGEEG